MTGRRYDRPMVSLAEVEREASVCTRCALAAGRTHVVFGVGDPAADLMFVGEGPGAQEDLQGEPFVGRSGQLLDRLVLEEMGLTRDRFYIANAVKCLRYNAMVQLGDRSWERIGRLVRSKYHGTVMSVNEKGHLVPGRVSGWHTSPLGGRRLFRMSYRSGKLAGARQIDVQLTGDHPVLTETGYVPVEELELGARIATGQGLSALARDVVCGTLLGDGHLSARSAHLSFSHCLRQAGYAEFKADLLAELSPHLDAREVAAAVGGEAVFPVVMVRTLAHRALGWMRSEFYPGPAARKVVPGWIAESLNARMLAFWFLDDGHLREREGRQPIAEIATCSFSEPDLRVLVAGLKRLGIEARVCRGRLHFTAYATRLLSETICPYVPPSMRYKLHPDVRVTSTLDRSKLNPGPPEVIYDEVILREITDNVRSDTTFFCIDVGETHNFVTAGGVVHNCRPPGNRDPRPDEIATCRPWLEAQVELIDPRVVVTLGNFATKLLLDTTQGITRMRGRAYPFRNGMVVPTFHPAAALRSGAVTVAHMRADLVRAKQLLAQRDLRG